MSRAWPFGPGVMCENGWRQRLCAAPLPNAQSRLQAFRAYARLTRGAGRPARCPGPLPVAGAGLWRGAARRLSACQRVSMSVSAGLMRGPGTLACARPEMRLEPLRASLERGNGSWLDEAMSTDDRQNHHQARNPPAAITQLPPHMAATWRNTCPGPTRQAAPNVGSWCLRAYPRWARLALGGACACI